MKTSRQCEGTSVARAGDLGHLSHQVNLIGTALIQRRCVTDTTAAGFRAPAFATSDCCGRCGRHRKSSLFCLHTKKHESVLLFSKIKRSGSNRMFFECVIVLVFFGVAVNAAGVHVTAADARHFTMVARIWIRYMRWRASRFGYDFRQFVKPACRCLFKEEGERDSDDDEDSDMDMPEDSEPTRVPTGQPTRVATRVTAIPRLHLSRYLVRHFAREQKGDLQTPSPPRVNRNTPADPPSPSPLPSQP